MPLYECQKCGTVENTACGNFWNAESVSEAVCSECHTGTWHGRFDKMKADGGWVRDEFQHGSDKKPQFITRLPNPR